MVTKKLTPKSAGKASQKATKKPVRRRKAGKKKSRVVISPWVIAGVLAVLTLVLSLPYLGHGRFADSGTAVPDEARQFCLDISHYNDGIVWDSLMVVIDSRGRTSKDLLKARRVVPVSRVVMKATEGTSLVDKRFGEYWEAADGHGYVRGAYHFFRSSADPVAQADHYLSHAHLSHRDLPPILDVETMHTGCSKDELCGKVLTWLRTVEQKSGRRPIVYTSDSYARDILSREITGQYPMWIARYNEKPPRFEGWSMWQFTDKAVLYGVSCYVDLSVIKP